MLGFQEGTISGLAAANLVEEILIGEVVDFLGGLGNHYFQILEGPKAESSIGPETTLGPVKNLPLRSNLNVGIQGQTQPRKNNDCSLTRINLVVAGEPPMVFSLVRRKDQ